MVSDRELKRRVRIEINDLMDKHCNDCPDMEGLCPNEHVTKRRHICKGCDVGKRLKNLSTYLDHEGLDRLKGKLETQKEKQSVEVVSDKSLKEELTKETYLKLRSKGMTNQKIAFKFNISEGTLYKRRNDWGLQGSGKKTKQKVTTKQKPKTESIPEHEIKPDPVNNPSHYTAGGIETIDFMRAKLSKEQFKGFLIGNVIKYSSRFQHKNGEEDIKKMMWYGNKLLEVMQE